MGRQAQKDELADAAPAAQSRQGVRRVVSEQTEEGENCNREHNRDPGARHARILPHSISRASVEHSAPAAIPQMCDKIDPAGGQLGTMLPGLPKHWGWARSC